MAFYQNNDEEILNPEAQPQQPGQQQGSVITGQTSSGGPTQGPNAPTGAAAEAGEKPAGAEGTGAAASPFVGIKQYLDQNKSQSAKLAQNVGNYVGGLTQSARDTLPTQTGLYNQAVDQATINLNQPVFDEAKVKAQNVANDQAKMAEFVKMRDAEYKGPASFQQSEFYNPTEEAYKKATTAGENLLTDTGQQTLLGALQQQERGRVNPGAIRFDQALLQGDEARSILEQAKAGQSDLQGLLDSAEAASLTKAQSAAATTAATRKAIQDTFAGNNSVQKQLEKAVSDRAKGLVDQSNKEAEKIIALLEKGEKPSASQLEMLGISDKQWDELQKTIDEYNSIAGIGKLDPINNLSGYVSRSNPQMSIDAQRAANAEEYARYAALNQLMGTQNNFLSNATLADTANLDSIDFNFQEALDYLTGQKDAAQAKLDQALANRARRQEEMKARNEEYARKEGQTAGAMIGGIIGGVLGGGGGAAAGAYIGAQIGGAVACFAENTPILMEDGSYKAVQLLRIGDRVAIGGKVIARGESLTDSLVEYKGLYTSPSHAIFDGEKWTRAHSIQKGVTHQIETITYPIVTENCTLISTNGVVYADLVEHPAAVGLSDEDKLKTLNSEENLRATKDLEAFIKTLKRD